MVLFAALPDALLALWLKLIAQGVVDDDRRLVYIAAAGLGVSATATWFLKVVGDRAQRRFRDRVTIFLESHVARLQASVPTIEHHERPEYLDRLSVLRDQVFTLDHMYMSVFSTAGWILRLGVTIVLLASVSPWLVLLVAVRAADRAHRELASGHRARRRGSGRVARPARPAPVPARHDRAARQGGAADRDRAAAGRGRARRVGRWYAADRAARGGRARCWHTLAWAIFGGAYVGAVVFVASGLDAPVGSTCCSCSRRAAGCRSTSARPSARSGSCAASGSTARAGSRGSRTTRRAHRRPRRSARARAHCATASGSNTCRSAIPGTDRLVLDDVDLELPGRRGRRDRRGERRGQVHAREAAVPVLRPGDGRGHGRRRRPRAHADLGVAHTARRRVPGLLPVRAASPPRRSASATSNVSTIVPRSRPRWTGRAHVTSSTGSRDGLDTQLGVSWDDGVEVSFGQWQKLALGARVHARSPAARRARRTDGRARCRDRTRAVRAYAASARERRRAKPTGASPCSCRTGSRRSAWPT